MIRTYQSLSGFEAIKVACEMYAKHLAEIPGFASRLIAFPRIKITNLIRVECFDREPAEIENVDELVAEAVKESIDKLFKVEEHELSFAVDETRETLDNLRRAAGIAITRPKLLETGQIVDVPDPLPAKENLSNIQQFGMPGAQLQDGTTYSGKGRVIEQESVGISGASPVGPKLKGEGQRHFRIRAPGE